MQIIPYQQSLTDSCLVACFLMLLQAQKDITFTEKEEQHLALNGSKRKYPFYVVGIPYEVAVEYNAHITIFADNKYFTKVLEKSFGDTKNIEVKHQPVKVSLIQELLQKQPLICYVDNNALGNYSHSPHFIVLEKATESFFHIVNPWTGKKKRISRETLEKGIRSLKTHVKMCPLLFSIAEI